MALFSKGTEPLEDEGNAEGQRNTAALIVLEQEGVPLELRGRVTSLIKFTLDWP